jgi:hypothetical protein
MNRPQLVCAAIAGLMFFLAAVRGETFSPPAATQSVSGQFSVSRAPENFDPFFHPLKVGTDTNLLRLEPALLAVSAERFKTALWREIGLAPNSSWSGKIFLVLHPARSLDEPVNLVARTFLRDWTYRLELPDVLTRDRYVRAFSAVLLLEIANRQVPPGRHSAAVPDWLVAGLGRQIADAGDAPVILSVPAKTINDLPQTRVVENRHGLDPLAAARRVLQKSPALTFDQLSWPDDAQLNGGDGDRFDASAQLFVAELLALKDGPAKVRAFLTALPAHENWQTAFFDAFKENFRRPLDVEKWWALRVIAFTARDPGPRWTVAVSREKLAALLAVPVDVRSAPNALPMYSEISLQSVIRNFDPARQVEILSARLRDLELAEFRLAPPLNGLAAGYAKVLSDYLHARKKFFFLRRPGPETTIQRLAAQDGKRREVESKLRTSVLPADLNLPAP